jgi:hypothetical protein
VVALGALAVPYAAAYLQHREHKHRYILSHQPTSCSESDATTAGTEYEGAHDHFQGQLPVHTHQ